MKRPSLPAEKEKGFSSNLAKKRSHRWMDKERRDGGRGTGDGEKEGRSSFLDSEIAIKFLAVISQIFHHNMERDVQLTA